MKKFTKILALILAAILSLSLFAGCGDIAEELFDVVDFILDSEQTYFTDLSRIVAMSFCEPRSCIKDLSS